MVFGKKLAERSKRNKEDYLSYVDKEILEKITEYEQSGKLFNEEDLPKRMNSYEQRLHIPLWSNELLVKNAKYYLSHDTIHEFREWYKYEFESGESYNDALKHKLIHLLIKRLSEKNNALTSEEFSNLRELLRLLYRDDVIIDSLEFVENNIVLKLYVLDVDYGEICKKDVNFTIQRESIVSIKSVMQYYKYIMLEKMLEYYVGHKDIYVDKLWKLNKDIEELTTESEQPISITVSNILQKQIQAKRVSIIHTKKY